MKRAHNADTIQFLTVDELTRLMAVIEDKRDRAIFLTAYRHGLRASEVGNLLRANHLAELCDDRS